MKFPRLTILILLATPLAAEDFYEQHLRAGVTDAARGRMVEASDELRIAAFGFLDRPALLTTALVNLALVQSSLGHTAAVTQTLDRFLDVERRFNTYAAAQIDPSTRNTFEALLLKSEPASAFAGISSLARLTRSDIEKVKELPADRRAAAYEQGFRKAPRDVEWPLAAARDAASRGAGDDVIRWSRRALAVDARSVDARAMLAHALTQRGNCKEALREISSLTAVDLQQRMELAGDQLVCLTAEGRWSDAESAAARLPAQISQRTDVARALQILSARRPQTPSVSAPRTAPADTAVTARPQPVPVTPPQPAPASTTPQASVNRADAMKSAEKLDTARALIRNRRFSEAARLLQPAVAADPANRQLRLALLEAAALGREWPLAVGQVASIAPFSDGEELSMFYAAISLYESKRNAEAIPLMNRARPRLASSPFVDYYSRSIGAGSSPK